MKAAKSFESASKERTDCETSSKSADKAVRDNTQLLARIEKAVIKAEAEVEIFQEGPLATFKQLQERAAPPMATVEEEVAAVIPMEQAALPETKDVEIPVAVAAC